MVLQTAKKIIMLVPDKLIAINKNVDTADKTFTYVTKLTGAAGVAKGGVDFWEAVSCRDGVCAVGVAADGLQISRSDY